jgi:hypothetical protein
MLLSSVMLSRFSVRTGSDSQSLYGWWALRFHGIRYDQEYEHIGRCMRQFVTLLLTTVPRGTAPVYATHGTS